MHRNHDVKYFLYFKSDSDISFLSTTSCGYRIQNTVFSAALTTSFRCQMSDVSFLSTTYIIMKSLSGFHLLNLQLIRFIGFQQPLQNQKVNIIINNNYNIYYIYYIYNILIYSILYIII